MLKSILNLDGVKTLEKNKLQSINGGGVPCEIMFDVCNIAYLSDYDQFDACMRQKGC